MMAVTFNAPTLGASIEDTIHELEDVLAEELLVVAGDVVEDMRVQWPRRTGRSAEGFEATPIRGGARISNLVPYVPFVHERGVRTLALDAITGPALERAVQEIPERAAAEAARRLT